LSYGLLVFLTLWQLITVVYSLIGPDMVKRYTSRQSTTRRAAESVLAPKKKE